MHPAQEIAGQAGCIAAAASSGCPSHHRRSARVQVRPSAAATGNVSAPVGVATGSPVGIPAAATAKATLSPGSTNGGRSNTSLAAYVSDAASTRHVGSRAAALNRNDTDGRLQAACAEEFEEGRNVEHAADGCPSWRCLLGFPAPRMDGVRTMTPALPRKGRLRPWWTWGVIANTPAVARPSIRLAPSNSVLRLGEGDR